MKNKKKYFKMFHIPGIQKKKNRPIGLYHKPIYKLNIFWLVFSYDTRQNERRKRDTCEDANKIEINEILKWKLTSNESLDELTP